MMKYKLDRFLIKLWVVGSVGRGEGGLVFACMMMRGVGET
tara:strand:+ start:551 stop:670 length:120 start_codon:yes stop_codon:yes gene_type:complete